jgi:hypothetical protein
MAASQGPTEFSAGDRFAGYGIEPALGRGGMATPALAKDPEDPAGAVGFQVGVRPSA